MQPYKEFGVLLRNYRKSKKLNQRDLYESCGISQSLLSQFENGKSRPKTNILDCLTKMLDLNAEERKRLYTAAGYVEDNNEKLTEIVTHPDFLSVLALLSDPKANKLPTPLARETVKEFADGWHLYAHAKEKQYKREWQEMEDVCDTAVKKLRNASNQLQAYLLDARGSAALHRGDFAEAERRFQEAEALLNHITDYYLEGQLLIHQGELLRFRSEWRKAEEKFVAANKAFLNLSSAESRTKCAWVDKKIGMMYLMQDQWDKALSYLRRSEAVFRDTRNQYELAKTCLSLGWAYTQAGDWHTALKYRLEGYQLSQNHLVMGQPDFYLRMQGLVYMGLTLHQLGFIDQAQSRLEAAKTISDNLKEMHERSTILVGLANLYYDKFKNAEVPDQYGLKIAEEYCQIAARETDAVGDKYRYSRSLLYQSQFYLNPKNADRGIELLLEAQRILRVLNHNYYLASVAIYLGRAYLESGRIENLHVCVDEGMKDALSYLYPYQRQLSELRILKAQALCHDDEPEGAVKYLAHALVAAVLYNRFQCEKIADQFSDTLECHPTFRKGYARNWGSKISKAFQEKMNRDSQSYELSKEQDRLITDVTSWLENLRQDTTLKFPKQAKRDIEFLMPPALLL